MEFSNTNVTVFEETPIRLEHTTQKSEINISLRQLNEFSNISIFNTSSISSGSVITLYVNLIGKAGMDENAATI